jgi:hypothetical protein
VNVRLRRQQILSREDRQLSVVLDESVLERWIGDDSVMHEQLQRVTEEADGPNLMLQILPLDAQHTVFGESFVIFGFGTDSDAMLQEVVSTEQLRSGFTLEGSGRCTYSGSPSRCSPKRPSTRRRPARSSLKRRSRTGPVPTGTLVPK